MDSKRIAGALVALAGAALASEWIVRGADMILTLFYQGGVVDWSAVKSAAGLVGMVGGGYFLLRPPNKAEIDQMRFALVERIVALLKRFEEHDLAKESHLYGEVVSVYAGLGRLRIRIPDASKGGDRAVVYREAYAFLTNIMPLIRDGHLSVARREAPEIIAALNNLPPAPAPSACNWQ